jgi:hypothetical protein
MIRLIIDKQVLDSLKAEFSKENKARQYLLKYVNNLEQELNLRLLQPRPLFMVKHGHYYASLTTIQEKGGQIWSLRNVRVHKWLTDHGLSLVQQVNKGEANNITGDIAIIRLTNLVQVMDDEDVASLGAMTHDQLDQYLESVPLIHLETYLALLPLLNESTLTGSPSDVDMLKVDLESTVSYIKDMVSSGKLNPKDRTEFRKAFRILRVAQLNDGFFPQKKRNSPFGRTYYHGLSVQSVRKDLRKSILNGCYEYDVKSSVISWKYSFAEELLIGERSTEAPDKAFWAIYYYLTFKDAYFEGLQSKVFDEACDWNVQKQKSKIKEALTALSFGAKLTDVTWKNEFGKDESSSLSQIFPNGYLVERSRFIKAEEVVSFKRQQSRLDAFIVSKFIAQYPYLSAMSELQTKTGRRSNSKVLAWLYQHAETLMMDIVRDELSKLGVVIRACIHDAIVVDRQLTDVEKFQIESLVRAKTGVSLFSLGETQYS